MAPEATSPVTAIRRWWSGRSGMVGHLASVGLGNGSSGVDP